MKIREFRNKFNAETGATISINQLRYLEQIGVFSVPRINKRGDRNFAQINNSVIEKIKAYRIKKSRLWGLNEYSK